MARLWGDEPGVKVLGHDRIILRKMDNTVWMYRTPWQSEPMSASPVRVPLKAIYILEKAQKNQVISQTPTKSITRLFACSFPPFYHHEALDFTLRFLEEVVKAVPTYELRFKPEKSVVELINKEHFT
jgi:hypothetical protein